jgi:hypothetical protein
MADEEEDRSGTVKVVLRFWRNRARSGKGAFRESGDYLPDGYVWPMGLVEVPKRKHTSKSVKKNVNDPYEWMSTIQKALKAAGVELLPPKYP